MYYKEQQNRTALGVQWWYTYFSNCQYLSNWAYDLLNKRENMSDIWHLTNYYGIIKSQILEKNL